MRVPFLAILCATQACKASDDDGAASGATSSDSDRAEAGADSDDRSGETEGCPPGLPPPSDPCIPACGNDVGVGQPCTRDGGECNANSGAVFCTGDFNADTTLLYCTKPCVEDVECGAEAVCVGDPADPAGPRGCIPSSCQ